MIRVEGWSILCVKECQAFTIRKMRSRMSVAWGDHIESDPKVLRGKPRIKGTRIPVSLILGYLAAGYIPEQIIVEFLDINQEQIAACLDYARTLAEFEVGVGVDRGWPHA
jgi:uncharacterized protein (DUF433 family)